MTREPAGLRDAVAAWLSAGVALDDVRFEAPVALGGFSAQAARVDATAVLPGGEERSWSFVVKRPPVWSAEGAALRLLQALALPAGRVPELVAEGEDEAGAWIVLGFVPGREVPWGGVPADAFDTLGRVHARYLGDREAADQLPHLDLEWWGSLCLDYIAPQLDGAGLADMRDVVGSWADDARVAAALDVLPRTLVHRDMHGGNVVFGGGTGTIIDWGEAMYGPPFVDLANVTARGSEEARAYDAAWAETAGSPRDTTLDDVGWAWATLQVRAQYMTFPLSQGGPEACVRMGLEGAAALDQLGAAVRRATETE